MLALAVRKTQIFGIPCFSDDLTRRYSYAAQGPHAGALGLQHEGVSKSPYIVGQQVCTQGIVQQEATGIPHVVPHVPPTTAPPGFGI